MKLVTETFVGKILVTKYPWKDRGDTMTMIVPVYLKYYCEKVTE